MAELVTEEMLATWFGEPDADNCAKCHHAMQTRYDCEPTALCDTCAHEVGPLLVAEVRRLRDALKHAIDAGETNYLATLNAEAAGYARAERDVVAHVEARRARYQEQARDRMGRTAQMYEDKAHALLDVKLEVRDGAHRGAAKEGT